MRKYDSKKARETCISSQQPIALQSSTSQLAGEETVELSIPIQFLNNISNAQATALKEKILANPSFKYRINPGHVDDEIKSQEIKSFTSAIADHGKQFYHRFILFIRCF